MSTGVRKLKEVSLRLQIVLLMIIKIQQRGSGVVKKAPALNRFPLPVISNALHVLLPSDLNLSYIAEWRMVRAGPSSLYLFINWGKPSTQLSLVTFSICSLVHWFVSRWWLGCAIVWILSVYKVPVCWRIVTSPWRHWKIVEPLWGGAYGKKWGHWEQALLGFRHFYFSLFVTGWSWCQQLPLRWATTDHKAMRPKDDGLELLTMNQNNNFLPQILSILGGLCRPRTQCCNKPQRVPLLTELLTQYGKEEKPLA